jgi:energy-coupling factor transporter ATP-binding protein EcfA2
MIEYIQFTSGYPCDLPWIGKKKIKFKKGINVLFGPNGCGKSTVLNTLKAYCGIKDGGWTYFNDPLSLASNSFPFAYMGLTPSRCTADVKWDGTPSFYNDGDIKVDSTFFFANSLSTNDGISSEAEQFEMLAEKPSSGQYRIAKVNKVLNMVRDVPDISASEAPTSLSKEESEYWHGLGQKGPQTILLDEPERALSIPLQKKLFSDVMSQFKDLQIILATHSIFALGMKEAHFIEFENKYISDCHKTFSFLR